MNSRVESETELAEFRKRNCYEKKILTRRFLREVRNSQIKNHTREHIYVSKINRNGITVRRKTAETAAATLPDVRVQTFGCYLFADWHFTAFTKRRRVTATTVRLSEK